MDPMTILLAIRTAANAASEAKQLYDEYKGTFSAKDEAELKAAVEKLRGENDALYASVQEKLARAAGG